MEEIVNPMPGVLPHDAASAGFRYRFSKSLMPSISRSIAKQTSLEAMIKRDSSEGMRG